MTSVTGKAINIPGVGAIRSKTFVELVCYKNEEAEISINGNRHADFSHVRFTC